MKNDGLKESLINNAGIFLERLTADTLLGTEDFFVKKELPFISSSIPGQEGTADLVAVSIIDNKLLCFVIECKREYRKDKSWIFERDELANREEFPCVIYDSQTLSAGPYVRYDSRLILPGLNYHSKSDYDHATNVFEFNAKKSGPNSLTKSVAYSAMLQANTPIKSFTERPQTLMDIAKSQIKTIVIIPVVVTTAQLYRAKYETSKIDPERATISPEDLELEERPWVEYLFPLPHDLQIRGVDYSETTQYAIEPAKRLTYVVSSQKVLDFFENFKADIGNRHLTFKK